MNTKRSILACGLPETGKTTFLAALWHVTQAQDVETCLKQEGLRGDDYEYVIQIHERWLQGLRQLRNRMDSHNHVVGMDLRDELGRVRRLVYPDFSGEEFSAIWEQQQLSERLFSQLDENCGGIVIFVNSISIASPQPNVEMVSLLEQLGQTAEVQTPPKEWTPDLCPDQVKTIHLIQQLSRQIDLERVAFVLSAWDAAAPQRLGPMEFIKHRMPMLFSYLESMHTLDWRAFGVSAQGCDYLGSEDGRLDEELTEILDLPASKRCWITVDGESKSNDLTLPIHWLMSDESS